MIDRSPRFTGSTRWRTASARIITRLLGSVHSLRTVPVWKMELAVSGGNSTPKLWGRTVEKVAVVSVLQIMAMRQGGTRKVPVSGESPLTARVNPLCERVARVRDCVHKLCEGTQRRKRRKGYAGG